MSTVFRVEKTDKYTVLSNEHLFDKKLSLKATSLLSLMLALPPTWDYTLTGLAALKRDGLDSVRAGINELEEHGYLKRSRERNELGQVKGTEYIVYESPRQNIEYISLKQKSPILENPMQVKKSPKLDFPTQGIPTQAKPTQENPMQLNTNISNTNLLSTNQSIIQEISDSIDKIDKYKKQIKEKVDYYILADTYSSDIKMIDELIQLLAETIASEEDVRIAKRTVSSEMIQKRFLNLDYDHIAYVIDCLKNNTTEIKNIKSYLLTALYNAPLTFDTYITTKVNHDLYGGDKKCQ